MKNQKSLSGKGWFVTLMDAISRGELSTVWNPEKMTVVGNNALEFIHRTVTGWIELATQSKKGWYMVTHPILGQIAWKTGTDFRTVGRYFFLRLNGKEIIWVWPQPGARSSYALESQVPHTHGWLPW